MNTSGKIHGDSLGPDLRRAQSHTRVQALGAVREVGPDREVARLQLEAQVQYRRGNNQDAIQLYSQLFQQHQVKWPSG